MRIETIRALPGPNIYIDRPVLLVRIELDELTEKESTDFPGFTECLLRLLPGLQEHHCAKGAPGGFIERLHGGTYFGHIVEHVTLELSGLAGVGANFGRTVWAGAPGRYDMIIEYRNEGACRYLVEVARELVEALVHDRPFPLEEKLAQARDVVGRTELGPSTRAIVEAAQRRGIPWFRLTEGSLVQLGQGIARRHILATQSDRTSIIAVEVACDKDLTKKLLKESAIPVPRGVVVRSREEARTASGSLVPPLAVKPGDGNQGKGISLRLMTAAEVADAYDRAAQISPAVVIEEFFTGRDYRVLVVDGKMVAASERVPAHVVGDGQSTIRRLIERENQNPLRGQGHEKALTLIQVDEGLLCFLQRSGRSLEDIPGPGERVFLCQTANLSTGGTAQDVTDIVHPQVARLCERAARLIGLDICGIDLIHPDIRQPLPVEGAGILEVNAAPGIRMHHHPSEGQPRDVGAAIIEMLYPNGATGRIPVVSITGTNGKTTVARMIGHTLASVGKVVGQTTTEGVWIDGHCVAEGDMTGFGSARLVLSDPTVEVAVLETARGGIVRRSLGYDWSDVGVLTNIQADHLGQDGIETIDDLVHIKSLVAERVREGGTLVLNADDERLAALPEHPRIRKLPRRLIWFSLTPENPVVRRHLAAGGSACLLKDGWLVLTDGNGEQRVIREASLPVTLGGTAKFQTANALAALAACQALGLRVEQMASALMSFQSSHNNGRMNLYQVGRGYLLVDYGHNLGAFQALGGLTAAWSDRRVTGVFTVPGDRSDSLIDQAARMAARCFDRLIIREDEDLRGRRSGEIAGLIHRAVQAETPDKDCRIVLREPEALQTAIREMEDGEVVVFFFEKHIGPTLGLLRTLGAKPALAVEPVLEPV